MIELGSYRLVELLGEGAMGQVYRGLHVALGRPVAIKVLKPSVAADDSLLQRFFAEARAVNIIRHENIVECTDLVSDASGRSYIVMELLEGRTLASALESSGRMAVARAIAIAVQVADAIGAAHAKGIVHRDLKPDNIFLIRRAGMDDYVKVLDFGIARLRPEDGLAATRTGALIGTPLYMSPEQARGQRVDAAADIYALGAILYQLLVGRPPFRADSLPELLMAHIQEPPPPLEGVPAEVAAVVTRALAKTPSQRFADMAEFRAALLRAAGGASARELVPSTPTWAASTAPAPAPMTAAAAAAPSPAATSSHASGRRTLLLGLLGAVAAAGGAMAFLLGKRAGDRQAARSGASPGDAGPGADAADLVGPGPSTMVVGNGPARLHVRSIPSGSAVFAASVQQLGVTVNDPSDPELRAPHLLRLLGTSRLGDDMAALTKVAKVADAHHRRGTTPVTIAVDPGSYIVFVAHPDPAVDLTRLEDDSLFGPTINGSFGQDVGRIYLLDLAIGHSELVQLWQPRDASMEQLAAIYPSERVYEFDEVELEALLAANVKSADVASIVDLLHRGGKVAYRQDAEHRLLLQADKERGAVTTVLRYRGHELAKLKAP